MIGKEADRGFAKDIYFRLKQQKQKPIVALHTIFWMTNFRVSNFYSPPSMIKIWSRKSCRCRLLLLLFTPSKCLDIFFTEFFSESSSSFDEIPSTLKIIGSLGTDETVTVVFEWRSGNDLGLKTSPALESRIRGCAWTPFRISVSGNDSGKSSPSPSGIFKFPLAAVAVALLCPFDVAWFFWFWSCGTGSIWTLTQKRRQFWRHSVDVDDVDDVSWRSFHPSLAMPFANDWWRSVAEPAAVDVVGSEISRADLSMATRWALTYSYVVMPMALM